MKKNNKWRNIIIVGSLLVLFLFILVLVVCQKTEFFDNSIYNLVRLLDSKFFDAYFIFITKFGNTSTILLVVISIMLLLRNRDGLLVGISAGVSASVNSLIKHIIRRIRPNGLRLIKQGGYSFPSGHAMISISVYGVLLYLVITRIKNKYVKILLASILSLLILSIGVSRIYVGVHYATDVLSGYILAIALVISLISIANKYFRGSLDE